MLDSVNISATQKFVCIAADGREREVNPHAQSHRIHAVAALLRERIPAGSAVGLLFRSEPNLIVNWFACLAAGLQPLVMQYPTRKQSRAYWIDSVRNTIETAALGGIIADEHCASLDMSAFPNLIVQGELDALPDAEPGPVAPDSFTILQLSSGTTGYRKAMRFTSADLARHVADYNLALGLDRSDRIVSWLPLYHDMGYVACFVMPFLLGIDVIMIDPIDWVAKPELLFAAIERHGATTCYMPNFGFEVMARAGGRSLPTMKRWISCSEPVSAGTARKFLDTIGAADATFLPCYAMAENIFAVSIRRGCVAHDIDGQSVVSCGRAIPGVDLKIIEGEIWVRSPTSISGYLDGRDIRDAEGFYPTGDLGVLIDGELFVSGRKQDLLIQAGRKFVLSDLDLRLNEIRPEVRGRAVTLAIRDERLGTETPTVLIEAADFFDRDDAGAIADAMKAATGLDQVDVNFVPPRFLTKTSSGKFNRRKSRADWLLACAARRQSRDVARDPVSELRASFPTVDWTRPVSEVLDSLSMTVLRIVLDTTPVRFDRGWSLQRFAAAILDQSAPVAGAEAEETIRIVSLADRKLVDRITEAHLDRLEALLGVPVTLEHVCLPPSPVLLSDLVFNDYFQPRLDQAPFTAVNRALEKLRQASVLLADDTAEMSFLQQQVYPALSHNLERDPRTDRISFRWPDYTQHHDKLPLTLVSGRDLPMDQLSRTLLQIGRYVGAPVFRVADIEPFAPFTADWEHRPLGARTPLDTNALIDALARWILDPGRTVRTRPRRPGPRVIASDPLHFCSHHVRKETIDRIVASFDSFCIAGQPSSLPYLRRELDRLGKRYTLIPSYSESILGGLTESYDCLLICGAMGEIQTKMPAIALQHIGKPWRARNLPDHVGEIAKFEEFPESNQDWLHAFPIQRQDTRAVWQRAAAWNRLRYGLDLPAGQRAAARQPGRAQDAAPNGAPDGAANGAATTGRIRIRDVGDAAVIVRTWTDADSGQPQRRMLGKVAKHAASLPRVLMTRVSEAERVEIETWLRLHRDEAVSQPAA